MRKAAISGVREPVRNGSAPSVTDIIGMHMHPLLREADLETRRAFLAATQEVAEQIYEQATPENFEGLVYIAVDNWIQEQGEQVMPFTPKMRDMVRAVVLDALTDAFGFETSELLPIPDIPASQH